MPGKAGKFIVPEKQQVILQTFARSRSTSVALAQRSKLILLAFEGHNNEESGIPVGLQHDAVGRWRDNWERWIDLECSEERYALEAKIAKLLSDLSRRGRPPRMTAERKATIFETAYEDPNQKTDAQMNWKRTPPAPDSREGP